MFAFFAQHIRKRAIRQSGDQQGFLAWTWQNRLFFLVLVVCSALPFMVLSSARFDVGTDYFYTYRPFYDEIAAGSWPVPSVGSVGRWVIAKLVVGLGGGHVWFFTVLTGITLAFLFAGIYQQSACPWISVALFVLAEGFFISMNGVMQYMGMAVLLFGFKYVQKQCFWKYAIFVLIGMFFHLATIIALPLYLFSKLKIRPWYGLIAVAVLSLLNTPLQWLLTRVVQLTPYAHYVGSEYQLAARFYPARFLVHALVLALMFWHYYRNKNGEAPQYRFFYYLELITVYLLLNRNIIPLADRVVWTMEVALLLSLPMLVMSEQKRKLRVAVATLLLGAWAALCYYEIFRGHYHEVIPYQMIFLPGVIFP